MEAKHTPGPWTADGLQIRDADTSLVATCAVENILNNDEETANAALIAAAPEMYEALNTCAEMLSVCAQVLADYPAGEGFDFDKAIRQACAAIAKAEGR